MTRESATPLVLRRTYSHDRCRVFDAFANATALGQWFSPSADIGTEVVEFDIQVGGRYRIAFTLPDGSRSSICGEFKQIEPPVRLCFTWSWEKPDPHASIETLVTIDFVKNAGTTEVIVSHERLKHEEIRNRHSEGWEGALGRLGTWLDVTTITIRQENLL